jgi:hypothetical protein
MRVTLNTILIAFFLAIPFSIMASGFWGEWSRTIVGEIIGQSLGLTLLLAYPVSGGMALGRWVVSGAAPKERACRAIQLLVVVLSVLLLIAAGMSLRTVAHKAHPGRTPICVDPYFTSVRPQRGSLRILV